uniref:Uncharacterized protein n=1 Tax=Rhizophora mucronata TaxID=61149 RepID=A0A2P2MMI3_RHIMU
MCLGLKRLWQLEVKSCPLIEEIITKGEASGSTFDNIMFPLLNSISLECLPQLASFYSGSGAVQCPSLKTIAIIECSSAFSSAFFNGCTPFNTNDATQTKVSLLPCLFFFFCHHNC